MSPGSPEISIIVPVYKVEAYLRKCVDSILAQTFQDFELILVDDGSPDSCPAICDEYEHKDIRVRVLHKPNGGLSDARNAGLAVARGRYVGFIDSDDWISEDMFELLYQAIKEHDADIAVSCHYTVTDNQPTRMNDFGRTAVLNQFQAIGEILKDREIKSYAWDKLYKTELFTNNDILYPVGFNYEDIYATYQLFMHASKVVLVNEPTYYYLRRDSGITGSTSLRNLEHKFDAVTERHAQLKRKYYHSISQSIWDQSVNNILLEGMDLYNYILRETQLSLCKDQAQKVQRFISENFRRILLSKEIEKRAKLFSVLVHWFPGLYHYMYSHFTFLRKSNTPAVPAVAVGGQQAIGQVQNAAEPASTEGESLPAASKQ